MSNTTANIKLKVRCAIYTRKSTDEGLDSEFNSLDAQRLACIKYVEIQADEGWYILPDNYDDGGFSGGTTERPALKRLLADIENKLIDIVVVYKIDRLSRSLLDFLNMLRLFDQHNVSFVSVTQQFNTSNSMGKFMINIMMTFAEYEREITRERTRDKIASSKKKGIWMGGNAPFGYNIENKKLVINQQEAEHVRSMFAEFINTRSLKAVVQMLTSNNVKNKLRTTKHGAKGGNYFNMGSVYSIINNPIYVGKIKHHDQLYLGEHQAIISDSIWQNSRNITQVAPKIRSSITKRKVPAVLQGLLKCGGCNSSMTPSHTRKNGKLYRYYVPNAHQKARCSNCPIKQVSATEIENVVLSELHHVLQTPELLVGVWQNANTVGRSITENTIRESLSNINSFWLQLWPIEQERLLKLMLEKVVIQQNELEMRIRADGLPLLLEGFNKAENNQETCSQTSA